MAAAAAIVAGLLASAPSLLRHIDAIALVAPVERVIRLDLRDLEPPPPPEPVKRLVDPGAPADVTGQDTDLISSAASRAQDTSDQQGDPERPAAQQIDDFDQLGANASPPAPPAPEMTPPAAQKEPVPEEAAAESAPLPAEPKPVAEPEPVAKNAGKPAPEQSEPARRDATPEFAPPEKSAQEIAAREVTKPRPELEPFKVAQATPPPPIPTQELRAEKGREGGGAETSGFTSFEANKHALGEYMLGVRNRVERQWRTALHLRYAGASRTDAVIHCVIRPDGTIESVSIVDAGGSLTYAVMCREAVEMAGPFGPFPFDVPEIFRTDNLEINWKFSYL